MAMISYPHLESNILRISVYKNPQKQRKPNPTPSLRANTYWDLNGRHQTEYDERLDLLPEEGIADTVAGEIFRAATKLYYDFHNNAFVNNTSGAINYLVKAGVVLSTPSSPVTTQHDCSNSNIFSIIYPYTIGTFIFFGEPELRTAIETLLDRTIEFLSAHPELDIASNATDYHSLCDREEKVCMERCAIRNRIAQEMNAEALKWAQQQQQAMEKGNASSGVIKKARKKKKNRIKAQDATTSNRAKNKAQDHTTTTEVFNNKENNDKKKQKKKKNRKNGTTPPPNKTKEHKSFKSKDIAAKFSKLQLFD